MKNGKKLVLLVIFIAIGVFLIISCYETNTEDNHYYCKNMLSMLKPRDSNFYFDPFTATPIFIPVILVTLSFFCQFPFNIKTRLFLILLFIVSIFCSFFLLFLGGLKFLKDGYELNIPIYSLIQLWDISNTLWLLFLIIPWEKRLPLIHWPFDTENKKTT